MGFEGRDPKEILELNIFETFIRLDMKSKSHRL